MSDNLQPVLRVVAGTSRQMVRVFTPGVAVPPFSVGTHADWVVEAGGVEPIHFFASFDGAQLHVAIGSPTAKLSLRLNAVGREWVTAQAPSALIFGEACLALSQEVIPSAAPAPSPSPRTQFIDPAPAKAAPVTAPLPAISGSERPHPFAGTAILASPTGNPTGFAPVPAQPRVRSQPVHTQAPNAQPAGPAQPGPGWEPQALAQPERGLGTTGKMGSNAAFAGNGAIPVNTLPSNAPAYAAQPPGYATQPVQPSAHTAQPPAPAPPIAQQPLWTQPEPPMPVARPLAGSGEPLAIAFDDSGPTTLVDRGALRDHAARIAAATPSLTAASSEAYAAKVRALSTAPGTGEPVPPMPAPGWGPNAPPPAAPPAVAGGSASEKPAKPPSKLVAEWRRASWLMRTMLVLLPVGAYVTLWTPGQDDPISSLLRRDAPPAATTPRPKHPAGVPSQQAARPRPSLCYLR
jgi:hypothetical protein